MHKCNLLHLFICWQPLKLIPLKKIKYQLKNTPESEFWQHMDSITFGQKLNPELGYVTQFLGNFDNNFAGRKTGNEFSIYLYRPISQAFRTEILAKGTVESRPNRIEVDVKFEIPFHSILKFFLLGGLLSLLIMSQFSAPAGYFGVLFLFISYILILRSNLGSVKTELEKQFEQILKKENKTVANNG